MVLFLSALVGCADQKVSLGTVREDRDRADSGATDTDTDAGTDSGDDPTDTGAGTDSGDDPTDTGAGTDSGDDPTDTGVAPPADCAAFGLLAEDALDLTNGASLDAYDASRGPWGGANQSATATAAVNAAGACALTIGGTFSGDAWVGPGADAGTTCMEWGGVVTGAVTPLPAAVALPAVAVPGGLPASSGDRATAWGETWDLPGDATYGALTLAGGSTTRVAADATLLVEGDLSAAGTLAIDPGVTLTVLVRGAVRVGYGAELNTSGRPEQLRLHLLEGDALTMDWGGDLTAVVVQPGGTFTNNGGAFSGTWAGGTFATAWGASTHVDTARICP